MRSSIWIILRWVDPLALPYSSKYVNFTMHENKRYKIYNKRNTTYLPRCYISSLIPWILQIENNITYLLIAIERQICYFYFCLSFSNSPQIYSSTLSIFSLLGHSDDIWSITIWAKNIKIWWTGFRIWACFDLFRTILAQKVKIVYLSWNLHLD